MNSNARTIPKKPICVEISLCRRIDSLRQALRAVSDAIDRCSEERGISTDQNADGTFLALAKRASNMWPADAQRGALLPATIPIRFSASEGYSREALKSAYHSLPNQSSRRSKALALGAEYLELATRSMARINTPTPIC